MWYYTAVKTTFINLKDHRPKVSLVGNQEDPDEINLSILSDRIFGKLASITVNDRVSLSNFPCKTFRVKDINRKPIIDQLYLILIKVVRV